MKAIAAIAVLAVFCFQAEAGFNITTWLPLNYQPQYLRVSPFENKAYLGGGYNEYGGYNGVQEVDLDTMTITQGFDSSSAYEPYSDWIEVGESMIFVSTKYNGVRGYSTKKSRRTAKTWVFNNNWCSGAAYNPSTKAIYFTDYSGEFYALDARTGTSIFNLTGYNMKGRPYVTKNGNYVLVALHQNTSLLLIDPVTQSVSGSIANVDPYLWASDHSWVLQVEESDTGYLYLNVGSGNAWGVAKIDPDFGVVRWKVTNLIQPAAMGNSECVKMILHRTFNIWTYNKTGVVRLAEISGEVSSYAPGNSSTTNGGFLYFPTSLTPVGEGAIWSYNYDDSNGNYGLWLDQYDYNGVFLGQTSLPNANNLLGILPTKSGDHMIVLTDDYSDHADGAVIKVAWCDSSSTASGSGSNDGTFCVNV